MRKFLLVLTFLIALLVVADRLGVAYAEDRLARESVNQIGQLEEEPTVEIHGFPFLTQLAVGRLSEVELSGDRMSNSVPVHDWRITLRGAEPTAGFGGVRIEEVAGGAVLPWTELNGRLGGETAVAEYAGDGRLRVRLRLRTAGQELPVTVTGRIELAEGYAVLRAEEVEGLPERVREQAQERLAEDLRMELPAGSLPAGTRITAVEAVEAGLRVTFEGRDLTLG